MIDNLSPLSRRILAIGLLFLVVVTGLNLVLVPLWQRTSQSLGDLQDARTRETRMAAILSAKPPTKGDPVPAKLLMIANDRGTAINNMSSAISAAAASDKVTMETIGAGGNSGSEQRIAVEFTASGSEVGLVQLLSDVETRTPAIRFERWSIMAPDAPGSSAKLQARAVAVWAIRP